MREDWDKVEARAGSHGKGRRKKSYFSFFPSPETPRAPQPYPNLLSTRPSYLDGGLGKVLAIARLASKLQRSPYSVFTWRHIFRVKFESPYWCSRFSNMAGYPLSDYANTLDPHVKKNVLEDFLCWYQSCLDTRQNIRSRVPLSCRTHGSAFAIGARRELLQKGPI